MFNSTSRGRNWPITLTACGKTWPKGARSIILDGLDEVPYRRGKGNLQKRQEQLKALALDDAFGLTRILVASRPYAYEGWTLPGFSAVELAPFENRQRLQLAGNLYRAAGDDEITAQMRAKRLNEELRDKNISRELTDTPLFITLMATVFASGGAKDCPRARGRCTARASCCWNAGRKPNRGRRCWQNCWATRRGWGALAYDVHEQFGEQDGTPDIPRELLAKHIFEMEMDDPSVKAAQLVAYLSENAGVLVSPGHQADGHAFRFAHRPFQEYLAARHIVARCAESYAPVREHMESRPQVWRLPCLLSGDVLRDNENTRDAYDGLWALVETLSADDPPDGLPADEPRWWSSWLAAEIALEQELQRQDVSRQRSKRAVKDGLVAWLVKLTETPQALAPVDRAACGRALAALGDSRPGVALTLNPSPTGGEGLEVSPSTGTGRGGRGGEGILLPDIAWVEIPAGEFQMGGDPEAYNAWAGGRFDIPYTFWMAKYPVTYAQYAAFVADDGYLQRDYWTDAGWQWRGEKTQPEAFWNDPKWHIGNHPVVGVTWYEAYAYTRWLTARYDEHGLWDTVGAQGLAPLHDSQRLLIRLPTEAEWEKAARYPDGRKYPWGDDYLSGYANISETRGKAGPYNLEHTTAVGLYPQGASGRGIYDLAGNVWEWCLTAWSDEYQHPGTNAPEGDGRRVLRGGSWDDNQFNARAASRDNLNPNLRSNLFGFRVVVGCPI